MKLFTIVLSIGIVLVLFGCGGDTSTGSSDSILSGRAQILNDGSPLAPVPVAGAIVTVQGRTATTDATGNFRIEDLTPGPTTITITKTGFREFIANTDLPAGASFMVFAMELN